jgi:hypothetical protein
MMSTNFPQKDEIAELVDAANELCAALEVFRINQSGLTPDFTWKTLIQRKETLWMVLKKFGY